MKLYVTDLYRVEMRYPLDDVQIDTLYYLYQPLIGMEAMHLYMMLVMEGKRMRRFIAPCPLSRLTSYMSMSVMDMEKALRSLEAIGLVKTYVKHENDITQYIYRLYAPLSLKAFFKNQILSSLLQLSLSEDDFQKTVQYFKISLENLDGYEDITARFQDVFTIQHSPQKTRLLKYNEDLIHQTTQDVKIDYDYDLLYQSLADYQVNRSLLSQADLNYATELAYVYHVDALTLAGIMKDAMESQGINRSRMKQAIQKYFDVSQTSQLQEVYHKQPIQFQTSDQTSSPLVLHMKYLDSLTPYELLKDKQGGKEPVYHDLMIVETLMVQLGLKPAVVNVLIEYVLGKNNNRLSKRYCEAIGASWARKNIQTAMDAYRELMNQSTPEQSKEEEVSSSSSQSQVSSQELMDLLNQLKEGQL